MTRFNGRTRNRHRGGGRSDRSWAAAVSAAALLLALAVPANAAPQSTDPHLSATVVGRLEPGAQGHLAVRWDGEPGALLDAWVDLDGDGVRGPGELVVDGRPLAPGIEVVELRPRPPARARLREPEVWVEELAPTSLPGSRQSSPTGAPGSPASGSPTSTATVRAMAVFDDGSGPALYVGGDFAAAGGVARQPHRPLGRQPPGPPSAVRPDGRGRAARLRPRGLRRRLRPRPLRRREVHHRRRRDGQQHRPLGRHRLVPPQRAGRDGGAPARSTPSRSSTTAPDRRSTPAGTSPPRAA